jgi:ABC-type multidrug transport system ATPase subunit/pSer/pThr/pTyr-binding forkhead associated (FHA) protein
MNCPVCGELNEEGYRFCRACGGRLPVAEDSAAIQGFSNEMTAPVAAPPGSPTQSSPRTYRLIATSGLLSGRTFTIGPRGLVIGRDPANCQVVLADDEISRLHAWITTSDMGEVVLRDRYSANGTFVNQVRVQEKVLKPGDEISVGSARRHLFRIEEVGTAGPPQGVVAAEVVPAGQPGAVAGGTAVMSAADVAAARQQEKVAEGTVAIKLTDLLARPHLDLIVDRYAVKSLDIPDTGLKIGRDPSRCQLVLEHPSVSAVHAELSFNEGRGLLTDRSSNGTFVNGLRIVSGELHDGDYITFGRYAGKSLIFKSGLEPQLKIEKVGLDKDCITIGRDPSNDVVIDHPVVSKKHAEIIKQNGKVILVDLGSTNGTFVNGIKVKRHQLQELDRIVIGPSELHFSGASLSHAPDTRVVRLDSVGVTFQVADRTSGKPKLLLDDISLVVKPKELIGLLGPSGAGKTTLMNALNGFVKPTTGQVLYNGEDLYRNLEALKSTIGFVPQEDIMHRQLSVRRCLYYAAKLRLPEDVSDEEVNRRVGEMLDALKVEPQRWDNLVSTLSGGQRKRVSLGIELLPKPGVLFLDEPTAGLDPRTETLMMMLFRQLANQGSTIIITTHLLGSFGVLDKVVVLLQGRLAYYGPGTKFLQYFKAEAPPDVYDDLTDNNTAPYALELKQRFAESDLYKELIAEPQTAIPAQKSPSPAAPAPAAGKRGKGFSLHQFKVLLERNWELKFIDRGQTLLLFLQAPIVALLVALMATSPNQIETIFMAVFAALWFGCSNAVREIVDEQTVYRRERQTGLKIPSYILSKLAVLSFVALAQCVSVVVILLAVHQALALSLPEVLAAIGILFLVAVNGTLIGLLISSLVSSPEKALSLFPLVLIPELLLCGLFLPVNKIHPIIPITLEELFEGKMFAQPEAQAKARQMANAPAEHVSPEEAAAQARAKQGEFAHQVAVAVAPSETVQKKLQKYTPAPVAGMPTFARWLSALAISRWGLEALADLCLHGSHSIQYDAYKIVNTVSISLHPDDIEKLEKGSEAGPEAFAASRAFPLPSSFWKDKGPYLAIMTSFVVSMVIAILVVMKRKDVT